MRVICAWCRRDGVPAVLREDEGPEPDTHGMCERHAVEILGQVRNLLSGRSRGATNTPARSLRGRARILLADDHRDSREVLAAMLSSADHTVLEARDGVEAIEIYRRERPDLAILDIFMPNKDGVETLLELCAEFPGARIIVISSGWRARYFDALSKKMEADVLEQAVTLGAARAIQKPIDPLVLLTTVDEVLATRRSPAA